MAGWLLTLSIAAGVLVLFDEIRPAAQEPAPQQRERRSNRNEEMEQVGPTQFRVIPSDTPYDQWYERSKAKLPSFAGLMIQDVRTVPLKPWPEMGVNGLYMRMADYQIIDGWVLEIPPKGSTKPMRHMFEAGVYFFGGPGHTIIHQENKRPLRIDWKKRSLLSIPLNVKYQHFNDGDEPVRMVAVTSFPFVINSTNSEKFIWENSFTFNDRYDGQENYLTENTRANERLTVTNFVPDALEFKLEAWEQRGKGSTNMHWRMAGNTMIELHVSEMPSGEYKRAHRHTSDAFVMLLSGDGYSLTWPETKYDKRVKVDWHEGTLFVPPIYWYHQHLNPGKEPARYLAINAPILVTRLGLRFEDQLEPDLPQIEQEFRREIARRQGQKQ
jgi:uncharacterized RmlC-like cupin family protein